MSYIDTAESFGSSEANVQSYERTSGATCESRPVQPVEGVRIDITFVIAQIRWSLRSRDGCLRAPDKFAA
jgi:hypothetical protein